MAASLLQENLRSLHESLSSQDTFAKEQSDSCISDIRQIAVYEAKETEYDLYCSVLFDKDTGVVVYLTKVAGKDEFQTSKQRILEFLSEFIQKVGKKISYYALEIKDVCLSLFTRDKGAKIRSAAISVIVKLLELTSGTSVGKDFNVTKMADKMFMEFAKPLSKTPATVKEKIYILLGVMAEIYPEYMTGYAPRLIGQYVAALKEQMTSKTKKAELTIISGCLEGLRACLVNFTQSADEGAKHSYDIFKYTRMAISNTDMSRYDVPKAGLRMIAKHASQFNMYLFDDYQEVYEKLRFWSRHHNREMMHEGMAAVESFLKQVSETLVLKAKQGKKEGAIFKYFIQEFRGMMNSNSSTAKELSLAIRGYGLLAAPCRTFLQPSDVQFMFSEMITKSQQQYLTVGLSTELEDKMYNLPSYLESLANIIFQLDDITETDATLLERLLIVMMENLPLIHHTLRYIAIRSMLWLLLSVMPKGATFQKISSIIVFQGLIRTCSHPPIVDLEQSDEDKPETGIRSITYKDYIELWTGLFSSPKMKEFAMADISIDQRHRLTEALYDELIQAILKIIDKLDLTSNTSTQISSMTGDEDDDEATADPVHGVQANKPKDFQILINLVDFCRELLPQYNFNLFEKWMFTFCHTIILKSTENSLVSGFYKLIAVAMKIANKIKFFENVSQDKDDSVEVEDSVVTVQQTHACFLLVSKFSKEVLVRMKQYRDDLLASCLTMILSLPKEIIMEEMTEIVPAIQATLSIGLSYLPLAMVALDALEYWSDTLPSHVLAPHYSEILPCLDNYLRTADKGSDDVSGDTVLNISAKKSNSKRKKMTVRLVRQTKGNNEESYQSGLSQVKYRIVKYLGSLGGCVNYNVLANAQDDIAKQAISWDSQKHLKFDMPFMDMKPTIYLDSFLPRIVELAQTSSDRQTKVAACELLHSLVLFCLGRAALGHEQERYSMAPLYKKMFPSLLQLACDVELVAKQLFEPLIMQIIHWFTNNKKAESEETMTLLDAIYDGMIQATDTSLRDFCAVCLKEFVKWSIKQTPPKVLEKSPLNIKSVLKRLYSYTLHPSAFKRLGAALAFNSIYTIFREETSLVDLFTLNLLVYFVESLAIAHSDDKALGTQDQCKKSLEHIERIIKVKADVLSKPNPDRKEPKAWSSQKLDIGVRWLLRKCGVPQTECRHMCMKLVYQLCPLVQSIKSPDHFFQLFLKQKKQTYFIPMFEGGGQPIPEKTHLCLLSSPTLTEFSSRFSVDVAVQWFDLFLAALDCYVWVFGEKLLTPADLFTGEGIAMSKVLTTLQYFVDNVALMDVTQFSKNFDSTSDDLFTPKEVEEYNRGKCTVVIRILNLLTVMIANYQKDTFMVVPKELWSNNLSTLICTCILQPSDVGFNLGDVEIMKNLPKETEQMLMVFSRFLPKDVHTKIQRDFKQVLQGDKDLFSQIPVSLSNPDVDLFKFEQLIRGYGQLHKTKMLPEGSVSPTNMAKQLFSNIYKGMTTEKDGTLSAITLSPTVKSMCTEILNLSFLMGLPPQILTDAILDTTVVSGASKGLQNSLGDLIFSTFKSTICTHIAKESDKFFPLLSQKTNSNSRRVSSILVSVIDHVTRDKNLRKSEGTTIVNSVLGQWKKFSCWWDKTSSSDLQSMALLMLSKLILIDSKVASDPSSPSFEDVFLMYQTLLTDSRTNLDFKCRVLELLPFFALLPNPHEKKLKSSIDRLIADNFPLKSSEFEKESPQFQTYTSALDRILSALELSGSLMLLEVLISIFCRERSHVYEDKIIISLNRFVKRLQGDKQKAALNVPYEIFCQEGRYPIEIRRATVDKVLISMLRLVQLPMLSKFFLDHMEDLRNTLEAKPKTKDMAGWLTSRLCCFELFEVLYSRMSKDQLFNQTSEINKKFCSVKGVPAQTGKEMTQVIMKCAHEAKSEDMTGETTDLELRREFHCSAYNLLISVVSCTQTDAKFYAVFLFGENEAKRQFLFDNLVDQDQDYTFPIEVKAPYERKKKFVSIRNEVKERKVRDGDEEEDMDYSSSFNLASMYLEDSSLHDDLNQYDFSTSGASQFLSEKGNRKPSLVKKSSSESEDPDQDKGVVVEEDYVELDMDELNQHECMAPSIALLKHMQQSKIIPQVEAGVVPELPQWMKNMMDKLKNPRTTRNVKLYLTKLIINTSSIFKQFASHWLYPLCQLLLGGTYGDSGINVFLVDVMVTMLSWNKVAIPQDNPEERAMTSRVVDFLIRNVFHETKQVFKSNLDLLKTTLQCWKDRVDIPYNSVYELLKGGDNDGRGIQVLGVILSCNLPPYGPSAPVDRERFFSVVANQMTNHYKIVYSAAAEVVGLIFKYLAEKERETEGGMHDFVTKTLMSIQVAKPDNFITCVHRMHKHYVPIADRFINRLLFMMPNLRGDFRSLCLEVLLSRIDTIQDVFIELMSKGLLSYLTHRDENTQLIALKIVKAIMVKLKPAELNQIYSAVTAFSSHPNSSCRYIMYDIMMWVYDNYREEDDVDALEILRLTKDGLLRGLGDDDLQCRLMVQNFWSSETRLPGHTVDRLVSMFEAMYSPTTERYFLSYATNLVLEMTSKSPDYQREIFEMPLEDCKFQDLTVKSSWRHRHAAMTPLFASTMATQSDMEEDESMEGNVRATQQDAQFSATQDGSKAPFNWLTQSSLDTYTDYSSVGSETSTSLMFSTGTADMAVRTAIHRPSIKPRPGFGQKRTGAPGKKNEKANEDDDADKSEFFRLKRRFKRDDEKTRVYFAKRNIRLQQMREMVKAEQKSKRESQVTMYRKYRIGDLPDIQIKYSYIIAPLQALAHRDSTVAKLLFGEVFKAIFNKMDEVKAEREIQDNIKQINTSIDTILSSSTSYFPPFISCVLDILFELRNKLTVDVGSISSCAVISNIQPLGIVVLEDQLIVQSAEEARTKRGRHDGLSVSKDIATWLELARLYKSVDEYDVLLGIFTSKIGTKDITKTAVEAESRCDYSKARTYYEEALSKDWSADSKPLDAEIDLWDDCRMKCLNNLTQWKELENVALLAVDEGNLSKVWDDAFYQEHYLPYIMRSKVKLMLQGDEDQQSLLDFVDAAMKNPDQKSLLESWYCDYLALMYAWQQDYDRSRHYTKMVKDKFLQEWCSTDILILSSRVNRLQTLQPVVELQEFLDFMALEDNFTSNVLANQLLAKWEKRNPHLILDSVDIWDDIVTNRNVYLDHISQKLTTVQSGDSMETDDEDLFLSAKVKLKLLMAESSMIQNNFKLSLNILAETKRQCKALDGISVIRWSHLYSLTHHRKAFQGTEWTDDMYNSVLSTFDLLGKHEKSKLLKEHAGLGRRHFVLNGHSYQLLATAVSKINALGDLNDKNKQRLIDLSGESKPDKIAQNLVHEGYLQMKKSLGFDGNSTSECDYGMDQAYLMVAQYCDSFLRLEEDEEMKLAKTDSDTFTATVIVCLLNAMKLDCKEARQRFPRLLQLVELYPNTVEKFKEKCAEVPGWMFIMWISQMVALLDKPEGEAIHDIILEVASTYPQAVTYPFKLSREGYKFGNTKSDKSNMAVVKKLEDVLNDSLVSKFVSALEQFSQPDQLFKDWYEDTKLLLSKKESKTQIMAEFTNMYKLIFDHSSVSSGRQTVDSSQSLVSQLSMVETGNYIKKFGARFKKDVESLFGKDGKKLASMSAKEFQQNFSKIWNDIEIEVKGGMKKAATLAPPKSLGDYCEWLADFNASTQGRRLEIPGQYDGESKPIPEYHVRVVGFDPRVLVMTSIRKPKRITIRGNDEKEYHYLVKGGEDLRQDQRIEQLFHLMNQVFEKNPACRHRKLYVRTYQVIPMTTRVGLIEWVKNTMPLKEFLRGSLSERENIDDRKQGPVALHNDWLKKQSNNQLIQYCQMYQKCSKTETVKEFRNKESRIPWDLMRRSFNQMSTSPEAFHVLRVNCAVSNSVMSMCQYVLGIGDRHLSNSMIDLNTGQMVGIDFGHAFGSATQFLPIPELMPFRLTRQLRNLMMPLQEKGLMESTMIHSLRALREDYDLLLNTMDIFIKEPSLDWLINAEKQKQAMGDDSIEDIEETEGDISWFPKQKIQFVLRKMKGHNPRLITRDELKMGEKRHSVFIKAFKSFENVVLGDPNENIRSQLPDTGLTVEQQVAALIDQATDPNILGRTYGGWEPWM